MVINGVTIVDTFAEAFGMTATRLVITAINEQWARNAAIAMTGFATSVIGCGVEAGIEETLDQSATPDGRPGVAVLLFAMSGKELEKQVEARVGQCVLTCPTSAIFAGLDGEKRINLGKNLRFFADGWQIAKLMDDRRYWRLPVMDGEFLVEETAARQSAVGGGNLLVLAQSVQQALHACERAVDAINAIPGAIAPFPGGVVRSGSKVGSKYKNLIASTNDAYCPTLRGLTRSELPVDVHGVLEIVIDGLNENAVREATRVGVQAVCDCGLASGIVQVSAGNYGGKLGQFHFHLHEVMA